MQTLWGLQYLRAGAALTVLFFHAALGAGQHNTVGTGGVDVFFVLSGFLMFQLTSVEPRPGSFIFARIKRIVPAYWLATFIVALIQLSGQTEHSVFSQTHLIKSLFFIPDFDPYRHQIYPVLIVGWTLNYEMFFYGTMTVSLAVPERWRLSLLGLVFAAVIVAGKTTAAPPVALKFYADPIIVEFLFGGALSLLYRERRLPPGWVGWVLIVVGALLMMSPEPSTLSRISAHGLPAAMIVGGVLSLEVERPVPQITAFALLGNASYSIYLWHAFVVGVVYRLFGAAPPIFVLAMFGGVGVGLLSFQYLERPAAFVLDRLARPRVAA